jgi:solute carrier family 25 S-adenosylmethionine transporter 26
VAGTSVDLLFFPIDTLKTRLQSEQGFIKAGGFRGVYKGVGSVALGSAPGGKTMVLCYELTILSFAMDVTDLITIFTTLLAAAAFFTTYDTLKKTIHVPSGWEPAQHLMAASCGEVVSHILTLSRC